MVLGLMASCVASARTEGSLSPSAIAAFGIGNIAQVHSIADSVKSVAVAFNENAASRETMICLITGICVAIFVALVLLGVVGKAWLGYAPNYLMLILVGVVANIFGQLGDLSMSLVKREAGIKDYSHLFLTHGGMLDRFDSTLFIAPVVWAAVCGGLL